MNRGRVLIVCALGAATFGAAYAGGQAMSEDEAAAPASPRAATPLAPAGAGLPQLGRAPLPRFRRPRPQPAAAPVEPAPPLPEPVEEPVAPPAPPPPPPPAPAPAPRRPEGPVITFDDSG